ncbi:hypothetical protein KAI46_15460 [bacterium]|nr:hypothetical protein [bacterium]
MRKIKEIEINGRQITINELTVEEVLNLIEKTDTSLIDLMFEGQMPLEMVCVASGIEKEELKSWYPADIAKVTSEAETVNPHSARMCKKLVEFAGQVRAIPPGK